MPHAHQFGWVTAGAGIDLGQAVLCCLYLWYDCSLWLPAAWQSAISMGPLWRWGASSGLLRSCVC